MHFRIITLRENNVPDKWQADINLEMNPLITLRVKIQTSF